MSKDVVNEIRAAALAGNVPQLTKIVSSIPQPQLQTLIDKDIISSNGPELLDDIFLGLSDNHDGREKHFFIIQLILEKVRLSKIPSLILNKLITSIRLEMPTISSEHLKKIVEICVESLCTDNDAPNSWKDILPECYRILSTRQGLLNHCDIEITTSEFISTSLQTLIQGKWPITNLTLIAIMFLEIPLSKDDHFKIVNKLCCDLEKLPSESLPPRIHNLLRLCKTQHSAVIYFKLSDYFNTHLYSSFRSDDILLQESESPMLNFDRIDECADEAVQRVEATCLYHTCRDSNAMKKFLVVLKAVIHRPSALLMSPFLLQVLLASECHKENCIQIVRSALLNNFNEESRRTEFTWCYDALPPSVNLKLLFNILIENSKSFCHATSQGILDLSISLICFGGFFPVVSKLQELGKMLLLKFLKKHPEATENALKTLRDKFGSESFNTKCIAGTLKAIFTTMPHTMMEHSIILQGLLEDCIVLSEGRDWTDHRHVIESMSNIIRLDSRLRDSLVMICRKGLFSRDPGVGCIAVCGYLSLVKSLKGKNFTMSSQQNSYMVLSQISMNATSLSATPRTRINNASVCMEVITLLKRCFYQSVEVREQLYLGLPTAMHDRSELQEPILKIIYEHLTSRYYVSDTDTLPPLLFEQCIVIKDECVTLQEPLGMLLFTIQRLLVCENPAPGSDAPGGWSLTGAPEQFQGVAGKLYVIMLSLANRISKCSTVHFIKDDGVNLNDVGTDAKAKCFILQQVLLCCEALIAFRINEWTVTKNDQPQKLLNLLKVYSLILDFTKSGSLKSKTTQKKNKSPAAVGDENDQNSNNENVKTKKKAPMKLSDMAKNKSVGFKVPVSIWDLYTLNRSLELLYGEKPLKWATDDHLLTVRNRRELHRFVFKVAINIFSNMKGKKLSQNQLIQIFSCAKIIYSQCISKLESFSDFDQDTTLLAIECFNDILKTILHHEASLEEFLKTISNIDTNEDTSELISTIVDQIGVQFHYSMSGISLTEDPAARKIPLVLFEIISNLLQRLPATSICEKWIESLKNMGSKNCEEIKTLGTSVLSCIMNLLVKSSESWNICESIINKLASVLGNTGEMENESTPNDFAIITSSNSSGVHHLVCSHLNSRLSAADTIISRVKADQTFLQYRKVMHLSSARASLKNRERILCTELTCIATAIRQLAFVACSPGPCCDAIIRLLSKLHLTAANAAAHFATRDPQAIQSARFDKLVKICGRGMTKAINCLIAHIESVRGNNAKSNTAQTKLIKDTKFIPRMIYNCEIFYKKIHQLSSKTKVDLECHLSKGSARDFKIKASDIKEAAKKHNQDEDDESMEVDDDDLSNNASLHEAEEDDEEMPEASA